MKSKSTIFVWGCIVAMAVICQPLQAKIIEVYPGKDALTNAFRQVREWRRLQHPDTSEPVELKLHAGVYRLYEPLFIRPEDSGSPTSPTIVSGSPGVVVSGGVELTQWQREGRLWKAKVPQFNGRPLVFRQLWINGRKAIRARSVADFQHMPKIAWVDKQHREIWVKKKDVAPILKTSSVEMVLHQMWEIANLRIKNIRVQGDSAAISFHDPESRLQFEHPWPSPMFNSQHNSPYYLTNARTFLDERGEWFLDESNGWVYYYPLKNERLQTIEAVVPAIETLIDIHGTADDVVHDVVFKNISFQHTTWLRPTFSGHVPLQAGMYLTDAYKLTPKMERPNGNHKLDNQGWLGRASAAVELRYAHNISFDSCSFKHLGASGVDYVIGAKGGCVSNCEFTDIAMNGFVCGSFSPQPHETHKPYHPFDRREVCENQSVSYSRFENIGNEDWGTVAICAGYVAGINIAHNEVCDVPYTGISVGWGWTRTPNCMHDNIIHANYIHHYARHMYDTAGIYTLGMQPNSYITQNVVADIYQPSYVHDPNHWFYLYTDEGSGGITVKDNWTPSEKFLKNANGPGNVWENNGPMVNDSIRRAAGIPNRTIH